MEQLKDYIGNVFCVYVILSIIENIVSNEKYAKYLRLFGGIVMIFIVIKPVLGLWGSGNDTIDIGYFDFEISDEELDEAYQQFLKKMKAEGKLDEDKINEANSAKAMNNDTKTAEIVKFPGFRNEASKEENLKDAQSTESSAEEIDFIAGFSDKLRQFEKEENKPWYKYGKAAGIAVLAAIGILAGSMARQADSAKFVSSVQHIINSEDVMP